MGETELQKAQICVIYATQDREVVLKAITALKQYWTVWSAEEIHAGRWDGIVKNKLRECDVVLPVVSRQCESKQIFKDEWAYAVKLQKHILPFFIEECDAPLGMGNYSRAEAYGWRGNVKAPAFIALIQRLKNHFGESATSKRRFSTLSVGRKQLAVPAFVFSVSSFETQLDPTDGVQLVAQLVPNACLVSAYDAHQFSTSKKSRFWKAIQTLRKSSSVLFLDSGNYEASRKNDYKSSTNPGGWCAEKFYQTAREVEADIVFTYDKLAPAGSVDEVSDAILKAYSRDLRKTGLGEEVLSPILHLPQMNHADIPAAAAKMALKVSKAIRPALIAIPERELGDGLVARMRTVKAMRAALDESEPYQALHILGTGNPTTIAALAAVGGDSFDGLEWCRTAANYETNNLLHFQHFDLLNASFGGRISNAAVRQLVSLEEIPFVLRAASYNYDYFCEWTRTIREMVQTGHIEHLLKSIPSIGVGIATEFRS